MSTRIARKTFTEYAQALFEKSSKTFSSFAQLFSPVLRVSFCIYTSDTGEICPTAMILLFSIRDAQLRLSDRICGDSPAMDVIGSLCTHGVRKFELR